MDPPDFESLNMTAQPTPLTYPVCERWRDGSEGSVFHLANIFLFFGFMGGSGLYGLLYLFTFLTLGFFCSTIWSWSDPCTTDTFLWTFALFGTCFGQMLHVSYRLRSVTFDKEFEDLYNCLFKKLGVSLTQYGKIVACCERDVQTLERDHCFAMEGKTAIDKLSVLLDGRIRVTVNGEFLHYIYPFQFLDSPEWDSLRPSEEGIFQVTLRADNRCRYVTWRRKKLYLLFAKHRYLAKIFALVVRNDIADKLYSLNDKAYDSSGHRYDLRLPSFCHPPHLSPEYNQGHPHLSPEDNQEHPQPLSEDKQEHPQPSPENNQGHPQPSPKDKQEHQHLSPEDNQEPVHPSPIRRTPVCRPPARRNRGSEGLLQMPARGRTT
ncbi:popeye domain-containing protein 3 [Boleophthalmus pectinirostris]|uniref:popeye domain-containing protein 3 n=1 Tax=Boleophthalmus pectinirostris TaxID=150288 RepID=UPI002431DF5E|nr:popeye domain-containing protein 3 [Boleophthalmus pectinirostris]